MSMYVNDQVKPKEKRNSIAMGWAIFFLVVMGYGIIGGQFGGEEELKGGLNVYLVCGALSTFWLVCCINKKKLYSMIRRYGSIMEADLDGFVSISEITQQTGKNETATIKELEKIYQKGFLINSTFRRDGMTGIILNNAQFNGSSMDVSGFVNITCPGCGATSRIRVGTIGVCEFCGSSIKG